MRQVGNFLRSPYEYVAAVSIRPMAERFLMAGCVESFRSLNGYTKGEGQRIWTQYSCAAVIWMTHSYLTA